MRTTVSLLLTAALLAGCDVRVEHTTTFGESVDDEGFASIDLDGIVIEVEPPVVYRSTLTIENGHTESTSSIAGKDYGVRDGAFFIGDATYGPVGKGDRVVVSEDGVFVNGERSGDAP